MQKSPKKIPKAELYSLIRIVQLGAELQALEEFKGKSLSDCVFEAACLIETAQDALAIVREDPTNQNEAQNN